MGDFKEEIYLTGGLDTDSDEKFIKQGDYVDALNVVRVEDGENGVLVNVKGNEAVYTKPLSGSEYLCGWAYYNKNESVILFIYSPNEVTRLSMIIEFNPHTSVATTLVDSVSSDILEFQNPKTNDYFIGAEISGDWLGWTDNENPPRMINIQDIKDGDVTVDENYLKVIKRPPTVFPQVTMGRDTTVSYNNIDKPFQFKYRYIYSDYRKSVYTSGSEVGVSRQLTSAADHSTIKSLDNYIAVRFNVGDSNVDYIEIAARSGNDSNWFKIAKIDKSNTDQVYGSATATSPSSSPLVDNASYYYKFYNNKTSIAVDNLEANKPYDLVPEKSESLSFISDDRLTFGGNTSGKDLVDLNVTLAAAYEAQPTIFFDWNETITYNGLTKVTYTYDWGDDVGRTEVYAGDYVYFKYAGVFTHTGGTDLNFEEEGNYIVFDNRYDSVSDIIDYIYDNMELPTTTTAPSGSWSFSKGTGDQILIVYTADSGTFTGKTSSSSSCVVYNRVYSLSSGLVTDQGFKPTKTHSFALVYYDDDGRKWPALISNDTNVVVEGKGDRANEGRAYVTWDLSSQTAPVGATRWRWAYAYKPPSFVQTICHYVTTFRDDDDTINDSLLALDVSAKGSIKYNYNFEVGDIIKILSQGAVGKPTITYLSDVREFEVLDIRTAILSGSIAATKSVPITASKTNEYNVDPENIISVSEVSKAIKEYAVSNTEQTGETIVGTFLIIRPTAETGWDYDSAGVNSYFHNALIEVRKPSLEQQEHVYYEIGFGGTCTGGTTTHSPSTGNMNTGDIWYRTRELFYGVGTDPNSILGIIEFIEDPYPYDNFSKKIAGYADPNIEYPESRFKYDNTILWSNKYFQDTQINGLSTFDFDDKKQVSDNFGRIKGLEELGNSLVVICEEKVLSGFVGATEYTDTAGNVNVVKSTTPIGYLRPHAEWYGTFLKESIVNNGKYVYFFDINNGVVVRKSANGLFPISGKVNSPQGSYDYKMRTYFKDKSVALLETLFNGIASSSVSGIIANYENVKCFMGYDPYYENVYITFVDRTTSDNNATLIFHEPSNRWICKYTSLVESDKTTMFLFNKANIFSFYEGVGALYELNSDNVDRCYLYGEARDSYIQVVSHANPNIVKVYNTIAVHSNKKWTADPIEIEANDTYSNGMYSKILDSQWVLEEGVYKSAFNKNMKTRSSTATNYDLYEGEDIRGKVVKVKLTNSDTTKIELYKIDMNSELSP